MSPSSNEAIPDKPSATPIGTLMTTNPTNTTNRIASIGILRQPPFLGEVAAGAGLPTCPIIWMQRQAINTAPTGTAP